MNLCTAACFAESSISVLFAAETEEMKNAFGNQEFL